MSHLIDAGDPEERTSAVQQAASALRGGGLVVLPTDTVYGIAADAFSHAAVSALLAAKGRGRQAPPPVLVPDPRTLDGLASDVPDDARALVEAFWPGALTVICWAQPSLAWDLGDTGGTVALRMPDHPLALEVLAETGPLAVSSANVTGRPPGSTAALAREQLGDAVEVYLEAGELEIGEASTIVDATGDVPRVVRQGALALERLREVVPRLLDVDGRGPTEPEPEAQQEKPTA